MKRLKYSLAMPAIISVVLAGGNTVYPDEPPEVKYHSYSVRWAGENTEQVIDYAYIKKSDALPLKLKLEDKILLIKELKILHSPANLYADIKVSYDGKDETLLRMADWGEGENRYFTANATLNIKEWHEEATEEQKTRDIRGAYYVKRIYAQEIDCDPASGDWNYIKIVLGLYREENPVIYADPMESQGKEKR